MCAPLWCFLLLFFNECQCSSTLDYSSLVIGSCFSTIHSFLTIDCSSLMLVIVPLWCTCYYSFSMLRVVAPFQHACCDLLSPLLDPFLCLLKFHCRYIWFTSSPILLVSSLQHLQLLFSTYFDTCNYSSPHTCPYVFALNKSWVQLTFRFSK